MKTTSFTFLENYLGHYWIQADNVAMFIFHGDCLLDYFGSWTSI